MERKSWQEKAQKVKSYKERVERSNLMVFLNFVSIDAQSMSKLRGDIKSAGGELLVGKNTLLYRAFMDTALSDHREVLVGPTAVVFSYKDPVLTAKTVYEFLKELNKDNPLEKVKGGYMQGRFLRPEDIKSLAELPPMEVLVSKLMGTLQAPLVSLIMALKAMPQKLVLTLKALEEKKT
jgi:large subunit ribosomal protein L10